MQAYTILDQAFRTAFRHLTQPRMRKRRHDCPGFSGTLLLMNAGASCVNQITLNVFHLP